MHDHLRRDTLQGDHQPIIVAIIGSSRHKAQHLGHLQRITLRGDIGLTLGFFHHSDSRPITAEQKANLDNLTRAKVAMANEVLVVNPNGYIGETTARMIAYATSLNKKIVYTQEGEAHTAGDAT